MPDVWGTSHPTALQAFVTGYQALAAYFASGGRDRDALETARTELQSALSVDPMFSQATLQLATAEINLDNNARAIELLESLEGISDYTQAIQYSLGVASYQKRRDGAYITAEQYFRKVIESREIETDGRGENSELIPLAYCGLISVAAQKASRAPEGPDKKLSQTVTEYCNALEQQPELSSAVKAQLHYSMALWYLNSEREELAQREITEVLSLNRYHWRAYTLLGQVHLKQRQYADAISALQRAIAIAPGFEFAHYQLGRAYSLDRPDDWVEKATEALSKAPSIVKACIELARIRAEEYKQYAEALEILESVAQLQSQTPDVLASIAWYTAEGSLLDGPRRVRAIEAAKSAVAHTEEKDWHKLDVLGRVYLDCGDLVNAETVLSQAYTLNPTASQVNYHLAQLRFRHGDLEGAMQYLIRVYQEVNNQIWRQKANELKREIQQARAKQVSS
jgi:tetratricopeptide (TPR) repeat protein